MNKCLAFVSALLVGLSIGPAFAVQLVDAKGKVLVNSDQGFNDAKLGLELKAGDQILVGEDSSASIYYQSAECLVKFAPSSINVVPKAAPCLEGEKVVVLGSAVIEPAADVVDPNAQAAECPDGSTPVASAEPVLTEPTIVPTADVVDPNAQASEDPPIDPCAVAAAPALPLALLALPLAAAAAITVVVATDDDPPVSP